MRLESTGATAGQWLLLNSTGDLFSVPDSTTPLNQKFVVASDISTGYMGVVIGPFAASNNGPYISLSTGGTLDVLYATHTVYQDLVSNGVNYVWVVGSSSSPTTPPGVSVFGVDTDVDLNLQTQGSGVVMFNYGVAALGGGAAATLGSIGGSGPGTAGQTYWLPVRIGNSTGRFFLPLWST